jgi:glycosyltransferase involved in cell wall biosynthesis
MQKSTAPLPRLAVITATRNRLEFLKHAIASVAEQDYRATHIIIDGNSSDGTPQYLQELSQRDAHVIFLSEPDSGISQAFNKGLALALPLVDWVNFLGDDDSLLPGALRQAAQACAQFPEAGAVSGCCRRTDSQGAALEPLISRFGGYAQLLEPWLYWGKSTNIPAPSTFISTKAIQEVGGFEERDRYAMDFRHWIKIAAKFPIKTVDQFWANFRYDQGTVSFSANRKQWQETLEISREYWETVPRAEQKRLARSYRAYCLLRVLRAVKRRLKPG